MKNILMKNSKKKTIATVVVAIISALLWAVMFAAITAEPDMKIWVRVLFILTSTFLFIYSLVVAAVTDFYAGPYKCKKCGHIHHINGAEYILSVHFGFSRYVTCEKCRKDTWHTKEFK